MQKLVLGFVMAGFLLLTACNSGSEFLGRWESTSSPLMVCEITHNTGNQYYVAMSGLKIAANYENGSLKLPNGQQITIDKTTGHLNLGGWFEFIKK